MRYLRWAVALVASVVAFTAVPAAAHQAPPPPPAAPGVGAWTAGPAASGDRNTLAGVIDAPASGSTATAGSLQISGWFVDLTAQGWSGADDVEIFLGSMDAGHPLGHAQFAQNRPDVAAALKNPFWAASGWSAAVNTANLAPGARTLTVYV